MHPDATVVGINLTPPEPMLDATHLDDLIDLWLDHLRARRRPETVDGYAFKLAHFRLWWSVVGPGQHHLLRRSDLERFALNLEHEPLARGGQLLSYHSQNDVLRRLRQMFRWAYAKNYAVTGTAVGKCPTL